MKSALSTLLSRAARAARADVPQVPDEAVALCRTHLQPVRALEQARIQKLLADLNSNRFAVRQRAGAELEKAGAGAEPALRKALREPLTLEAKKRLTEVLERLAAGPERLREGRTLEVLESVATPETLKFLEELAGGAEGARLTREAAAARDRLRR